MSVLLTEGHLLSIICGFHENNNTNTHEKKPALILNVHKLHKLLFNSVVSSLHSRNEVSQMNCGVRACACVLEADCNLVGFISYSHQRTLPSKCNVQ